MVCGVRVRIFGLLKYNGGMARKARIYYPAAAEPGQRVHRDSSTLSAAAKELEGEGQTDRELRRLMTKIREELS